MGSLPTGLIWDIKIKMDVHVSLLCSVFLLFSLRSSRSLIIIIKPYDFRLAWSTYYVFVPQPKNIQNFIYIFLSIFPTRAHKILFITQRLKC
ncbi:hypothetical protein JOM56_008038 [Amanita muscaria]